MRIGFKTTIEETLIKELKMKAIEKNVNVNDILEELIEKYFIYLITWKGGFLLWKKKN